MSLTFIDLFAGVGMMRIGLEQAGHTCIGFCEWDKAARKTYEAMHKGSEKEWTEHDIRNAKGTTIPRADIWTAGFPCTDISKNGKQKGLAGERSGLFTEVIRLIKEVPEHKKPAYLLFENVDNTLSVNKGWDFARILAEMDGVGYDAEWDVITSTEVGIPQRRKRIFIAGYLRGSGVRRIFS
ncbi:DNA (cytosine-5-)-methyltransferase [Bacillus cereus]|nr:DNA (cytosine-5-)-methyltransferase [Bacillus cereus]PFE80773.1 DNA (cytosine-5-)-methyltransferase [Bacillus cereus]PFF83863.1 DNA (cytosine-5-)-methyltransferase [Bacillus cereus]PFV49855.1 DNA (cytosine-5-)-methyltransferase [Bacillus cereus]PGP69935.1 DNA (cytosine-5-)-methyltransferase [Bacillus cereus]